MQINKIIHEIGQTMPRGYKSEIGRVANVAPHTITRVFQGKGARTETLIKIIEAYKVVKAKKEQEQKEFEAQMQRRLEGVL